MAANVSIFQIGIIVPNRDKKLINISRNKKRVVKTTLFLLSLCNFLRILVQKSSLKL